MAAALIVALAACTGDGDDRDARPGRTDGEPADEATAGDTPAASAEELFAGGHLASAELGFGDFTITYEATVAARIRYAVRFGGDGFAGEYVRIDDDVYSRTGSEADLAVTPFVVAPVDESMSRGALLAESEGAGASPDFIDDGIIASIVVEALLTDPASVLDPLSVPPGRAEVELQLPDDVEAALDSLGIDAPDLEVVTHRRGKRVSAIDVRFDVSIGIAEGRVQYDEWGRVDPAEVVEPAPEEVDATPLLDEDALTAFADAPLLAPTVVPFGLDLARAVVLEPQETVEGCEQVQLDFLDVDDPSSSREFTLFLLPTACALDHDPGPFDEVVGGRPARGDGYEVLVDATVVQVTSSNGITAAEIDAMVASLVPVAAADLIAAVTASAGGG